ncbi:Na+:solute symporter [soil metagenome]
MHWIDVAVIFAFIAYAINNGIQARKLASKGPEEYFLAGRTLPGWKAGLSMAATQFAADTPLLVAGMIAVSGIFSVWRFWIYGVAFLVLGFLLAGSWQRAGVITDAELTELRYGKKPAAALRGIKAFYFGTVFNCVVLAMVLLASTRIAEPFLLWNDWLPSVVYDPVRSVIEWVGADFTHLEPGHPEHATRSANNLLSILAILLVTFTYSATGGLRSVVDTDVMQLGIILVATLAFAWYMVDAIGGLWKIPEEIYRRYGDGGGPGGISASEILAFDPSRAQDAGLALLVVFATQWLFQINADGTGYLAQRTMACRSPRDARWAALILTFVQILLRSLLWLPIGLGLLLIFPHEEGGAPDQEPRPMQKAVEAAGEEGEGIENEDDDPEGSRLQAEREFLFVKGFENLLPVGLLGLMLTGMLAALASTVDTHLNWGASYWTNDIVKRFVFKHWLKREPDPRFLVWVARGSYVGILLIALTIMTFMPSIRDAWQASLLLGAGIGPLLLARWLWWRVNAWAEIAATAASALLVAPLMLWGPGMWIELLIMGLGCTAIGIATAFLVGPEDEAGLSEFYRRTRPPGYWGPIAEAVGDEPFAPRKRLRRGALATLAAAISVFSLLTGIGSWMCASPPPTWFPYPVPWYVLTILLGLALIPVWYRLGFDEPGGEPKDPPTPDPERGEKAERQVGSKAGDPGEAGEPAGGEENPDRPAADKGRETDSDNPQEDRGQGMGDQGEADDGGSGLDR